MRNACPPLVMHYFDAGQVEFVKVDATDGDDGAVTLGACGRCADGMNAVCGRVLAIFSSHVHARDIPAVALWAIFPAVRSLKEGLLQGVQKVPGSADGTQQVLGLDGKVIFSVACYIL